MHLTSIWRAQGWANNSCELRIHGEPRTFKGLKIVRRTFKLDIYRSARLQPRVSDVDFGLDEAGEATADDDAGAHSQQPRVTAEQLGITFDDAETKALCSQIAEFIKKNDPAMPVVAHFGAAVCLNGVMMKMLQNHTAFESQKDATSTLTTACIEESLAAIPNTWHFVGLQFDIARKEGLMEALVLIGGPVQTLAELAYPFGVKFIAAMRQQLLWHLMTSLGNQMCVGRFTYLTHLVMKGAQEQLAHADHALSSPDELVRKPIWAEQIICTTEHEA